MSRSKAVELVLVLEYVFSCIHNEVKKEVRKWVSFYEKRASFEIAWNCDDGF